MRVLVFTHMYPSARHPESGVFVQQQVESLRREGIDVDVMHADVKNSKWMYPWSFLPMLGTCLSNRYDLVHAHYVFAGVVSRSQLRFPVVLTHHGDEAFYSWQARLCWLMSRVVDKTIAVTKQIKDAIGLEDAAVIPCGVDFDLFRPMPQEQARAELGLPRGRKLVLFAGNYPERRKRFDIVQDAVALLTGEGVDVDLVVSYKQPYQRVPLFMNACDVLILPSEREGSPQVVKEAMACNLPVISVDVGDVPEVLDGVEGCYVCRRDAIDIAEKLALVLRRGQRTEGREHTRRYELSAIARNIIRVYEDTLSSRKREVKLQNG